MPKKLTLFSRSLAMAKRNPLTTLAAVIGIFGGIPAADAGVVYLDGVLDPVYPAQRYWVREHTDERLKPWTKQFAELDYLILKEQRKALTEAKDDLRRDPNSTSAPTVIERLQKSIETREKRLDAATKK